MSQNSYRELCIISSNLESRITNQNEHQIINFHACELVRGVPLHPAVHLGQRVLDPEHHHVVLVKHLAKNERLGTWFKRYSQDLNKCSDTSMEV